MKTNRILPIFIFFVLLFLCIAGSGYAQSGAIAVDCFDASSQPLKGVTVWILPLDGSQSKDEKSNNQGAAVFENVPDGVYRIVGRKEDYAPAMYEYVSIRSSQESVSLTLNSGADTKFYFEDPALIGRSYELLQQGINASREGQYAEAETALIQANELEPSNAQALYYLGVFYVQIQNFEKAGEFLEKASEVADLFAALPPVEGKDGPAGHKQTYNDAQSLMKNMLLIQGQLALQEKQYDKAVDVLTEASKNDPNNSEVFYQLALALAYAEEFDEANNAIETSLQLNPGDKKYTDLKSQIAARKENAAIRNAQALLNEGNKLFETGIAAEAILKYREALDMLPEDKEALVWRQIGKARVEMEQTDAAAEAFIKAAELAPEKEAPVYFEGLAQFYLEAKKHEEALDALTHPKALQGGSSEKVLMDLFAKTRNKDPKLAEVSLERVIQANPENDEAHFLLGQMYYADGQEMDVRTKELLTKYIEIGQDPNKISLAKDMLVIVDRRSK